jgi:hypothetical protein
MFEKVVINRVALTRHWAAPQARERELFLAWLHRGGNGLGNLRITAGYLLQIDSGYSSIPRSANSYDVLHPIGLPRLAAIWRVRLLPVTRCWSNLRP